MGHLSIIIWIKVKNTYTGLEFLIFTVFDQNMFEILYRKVKKKL